MGSTMREGSHPLLHMRPQKAQTLSLQYVAQYLHTIYNSAFVPVNFQNPQTALLNLSHNAWQKYLNDIQIH